MTGLDYPFAYRISRVIDKKGAALRLPALISHGCLVNSWQSSGLGTCVSVNLIVIPSTLISSFSGFAPLAYLVQWLSDNVASPVPHYICFMHHRNSIYPFSGVPYTIFQCLRR